MNPDHPQRDLVEIVYLYCCQPWPIAVGYPVGTCGVCGEQPLQRVWEDDHGNPIEGA